MKLAKWGISIVIPVYNAEKYLDKCLRSLEKQTFQDFEVLFVNDGSTDGSLRIIENFSKKNPERFRVFNKQNGGQSSARNLALPYIKGGHNSKTLRHFLIQS